MSFDAQMFLKVLKKTSFLRKLRKVVIHSETHSLHLIYIEKLAHNKNQSEQLMHFFYFLL